MTTYELTLVGRGEAYPEPNDDDLHPRVKFRAKRSNGDKYGVIVSRPDATEDLVADLRRQLVALGIDPSRLERVNIPPMPRGLTERQLESFWEAMSWHWNVEGEPRGWQPA